jgi:drug/metabolite transporter (DMT)-like permease
MDNFGPLYSFLSSLTWALGVSVYSRLATHTAPTTINWTRVALAWPVFVFAAWLEAGSFLSLVHAILDLDFSFWILLSASVLCSYAAADVVFMKATQSLGAPTALAIASVYPVWSALLGSWVNKQSLSALQWMGLLAVVAGVSYVVMCDRKETKKISWFGVLAALAVSLLWSANTWTLGQLGSDHSMSTINVCRMGLAILLLPMIHRILREDRSIFVRGRDLKRFGVVFLVEAAAGAFFFVQGLALSPLAVGAALSSLAPVLVVPLAVLSGSASPTDYKKIPAIVIVVLGLMGLLVVVP